MAVVLAIGFPRRRWVRVICVVPMLALAALAWGVVVTSHRIAVEKAGITSWQSNDPFIEGVLAARDVALGAQPLILASVAGLVVLALLPLGKRS